MAKETYNLKADAELIIEKYKCKFSCDQIWFFDDNKWCSASLKPLSVIITRELGERYKSSHSKIEQIEKFIKDIVRDKHTIDIKKSFCVHFLNGYVKYDKKCYYEPENITAIEQECFHKYVSEDEFHTFTPAIINDDFIGVIGSKELNEKLAGPEGEKVVEVVNKYYDFLAMDQTGKVREDIKMYLLALGWLAHSTQTLEQITYLIGDGANGKSWYTNKVLYGLVGKNNFGSFKLDKINDTFAYQPFLNKTLMVDPDAKNSLIEDDKFKSLAGTDVVNINIKNKDAISTELFSTVILCTNHLPKYVDYSSSMSRRMVLIKLYACVFENIYAKKKTKNKYALTDSEQKVFFSDLSKQYQRSLMFDAFCKMYDVESKILTTPSEATDLNQELEKDNNELYSWCEETNWLEKDVEASETKEIFVYPQYIFEKYRDYYKENNDGSDKGFTLKRNGIWQRFKELLESKYRDKFIFDTNKKIRVRVGDSQPTGFYIKSLSQPTTLSDAQIDAMIESNNQKLKEYLVKIEELKNESKKLNDKKLSNKSDPPVSSAPVVERGHHE